jgi:hypothetical protein
MDKSDVSLRHSSKALEELAQKGFTVDFNTQENRIINSPHDFEIEHVYRYEGESDPGDEVDGIRNQIKHGRKRGFRGRTFRLHRQQCRDGIQRIEHQRTQRRTKQPVIGA